jgi:hypothetical protein
VQVTLDNLRDPANNVDQESDAVALGYYNLGSVIDTQNENIILAEMLAREALRIRTQLYGNDHHLVGHSVALLAGIFRKQGNLGDEVKELFERALAISIKNEGPDGVNTSIGNTNLGYFYRKLAFTDLTSEENIKHLHLSKFYYTEALRIKRKIFGLAHHNTIDAASDVSDITRALSEA